MSMRVVFYSFFPVEGVFWEASLGFEIWLPEIPVDRKHIVGGGAESKARLLPGCRMTSYRSRNHRFE